MTTIEFFSLWEIDKRDKQFNYMKKRFLQEYPNSNPILTQHEDGEFVVKFFIIDYEDKNLDIYLCEEICNEFEFFTEFSNFQIVALCKLELLRNDNKFRRNDGPNPQQLLNDFINNWKEKEFTEFSFRERGSFQLDLQKIIPFKWKSFGDMAEKNIFQLLKIN